ncbi:ParB N-terminal domain-containing protein [Persicobacter diffluens]|uniref:ParB-like N-terminal domain-containing protein n=1 Tax=Persicobacter diffluens TaxID=981 RepID=A0AAN4W5H8_9BACT|nr:hypothetical protein PEDI_55930 [Persicobacter diffluens]
MKINKRSTSSNPLQNTNLMARSEAAKEYKKYGMISAEELITLPEIESHIALLSEQEVTLLKEDIQHRGIVDPLATFKDATGKVILVDGHHRLKCVKTLFLEKKLTDDKIPVFEVEELKGISLQSLDPVFAYMNKKQMARRNISANYKTYLMGQEYVAAQDRGETDLLKTFAKRYHCHENTISNAVLYFKGASILKSRLEEAEFQALIGVSDEKAPYTKAEVMAIGKTNGVEESPKPKQSKTFIEKTSKSVESTFLKIAKHKNQEEKKALIEQIKRMIQALEEEL